MSNICSVRRYSVTIEKRKTVTNNTKDTAIYSRSPCDILPTKRYLDIPYVTEVMIALLHSDRLEEHPNTPPVKMLDTGREVRRLKLEIPVNLAD